MASLLNSYEFSLPAALRERGITLPVDRSTQGLVRRLDRGLPISIAVLGSSVAQMGGCLRQMQDDPRCLAESNGFFVRFFNWLNRTWPHPEEEVQHEADNSRGNAA